MKKAKKVLSLMLVLIMCFSVVPMTGLGIEASAAESWWMPLTSYTSIGHEFGCECGAHGGPHGGQDIPALFGTPVRATKSGIVKKVFSSCTHNDAPCNCGYTWGNYVKILHDDGQSSLYAHLSVVSVKEDDYVSQGQTIGEVGNTGNSSGPHLHFEIYNISGVRINPMGPGLVDKDNPSPSNKEFKVGDIIEFGSYPQSKVTDSATISALNAKAPSWDKWTSYGYYSGDGNIGSMKQGDWMRYTDVVYNGVKYRGVKFTQYRPYWVESVSSASYSYQDDNGYKTNVIYWFIFEALSWRVVDPSSGLVMCEIAIDSQPYSNTIYSSDDSKNDYFNDSSKTNYITDYETSFIRKWLNDQFYNIAFTANDKKKIITTKLNNDSFYTLSGNTGYEKYDSAETNDNVFLLSYSDVTNSAFGFSSNKNNYDDARRVKSSDYASAQGIWKSVKSTYSGNVNWMLRTPGINKSYCGCFEHGAVGISSYCFLNSTSDGVRPAITLKSLDVNALCKHPNPVNKSRIDSNCIDIGFTAGVYCNDCETWISGHEVIAVSDHKDNTGDGKCDTCLKQLSTPNEPEQKEEGNIFTKIIDFFKNLFNKFLNLFR